MPKPSKGTSGAHVRTHSRSSSTSKLGPNLQFTQKDLLPPPKHSDKVKKSTFPHEAHTSTKAPPPFVRLNSNQRVHSREQLAPQLKRPPPPPPPPQKPPNGKSKPGFTLATSSDNADDDDDDEWVSSESGAATPSHQDSTSDTSSGTDEDHHPTPMTHPTVHSDIIDQHGLIRVDTARPFDFEPPTRDHSTPKPVTPPPPPPQQRPSQQPTMSRRPTQPSEPELNRDTTLASVAAPVSRHSPRPSSKRYSRPPSTHSISSRAEHPLRPHPLIRGQSYGHLNVILPKPTPLAPLAVIPNAEVSHSSPPETANSSSGQQQQQYLSSSPTSMKTSSASPILPDLTSRRTSFSSTGSINTIPIHSSSTITAQTAYPSSVYRSRTLSTLSSSSSSAALSSLTQLPYVLSHTRPPSPTPHTISFFPPVNPQHAHAMEGIHPLLPAPYLSNHLTVLARRTPIRESFDRVVRARSGR